MSSLSNPEAFFGAVRASVFAPSLSTSEVSGCNAILEACDGWPITWAAYALATAFHETAHTMQPIHEMGGPAYFTRLYDIQGNNPALARRLGNLQPGDGALYSGRGYVQLTGRANYAKAQAELGFPLVEDPDLALRADVAAAVMARGMSEGWFTGKRLADYLPTAGFAEARRIINGTDRAEMIAGYARAFQAALVSGTWT